MPTLTINIAAAGTLGTENYWGRSELFLASRIKGVSFKLFF